MTTWTKEPPKEPGWYWRRARTKGRTATARYSMRPTLVALVLSGIGQTALCYEGELGSRRRLYDDKKGEWWPIPISPPQEGAQEE